VLTSQKDCIQKFSGHVSVLIAAFCMTHKEELDEASFLQLVDEAYLPTIDPDVALDLMELEQALVVNVPADSSLNAATTTELSNLQNRCITSFASKWETIDAQEKDRLEALAHTCPGIMRTLLDCILLNAKAVKRVCEKLEASNKELQVELDTARKQHQVETETTRQCYQIEIRSLRTQNNSLMSENERLVKQNAKLKAKQIVLNTSGMSNSSTGHLGIAVCAPIVTHNSHHRHGSPTAAAKRSIPR